MRSQLRWDAASLSTSAQLVTLVSGGGSVGPNLTDQYWVHGGSISDIYKTVKYGVPEKGMISWQSQLSPEGHACLVSSYILTLQGTNPRLTEKSRRVISMFQKKLRWGRSNLSKGSVTQNESISGYGGVSGII